MRTFILNTINQIPATNKQLDYKSTLKTNEWMVFTGSEDEVEKFLFMDKEELLVSVNGKTSSSKWQFMKVNSSLIIDDGINKYMFKVIVCNKDIVFLNVDSTNNYSFLINTQSKALKDASLKDIKFFLMKEFNIDLFDNDVERAAYYEAKKEKERIEQEKTDQRVKGVLKGLGVTAIILIAFFATVGIAEHIDEKKKEKEEYRRTHPEMTITRIENRRAVDLGLSVKWATCNIGANQPTEEGNKYGWGDSSGVIYTSYTEVCGDYNNREYRPEHWGLDEYAYPTRKGIEAPRSIVGTQYDVARNCWGENWRMPTRAEARELINSCEFVIRDSYIVAIGPSGDSILFPLRNKERWIRGEYATGELDTTPFPSTYKNKYIHSFIIGQEMRNGSPVTTDGKLTLKVKMDDLERNRMLTLRAVFEE